PTPQPTLRIDVTEPSSRRAAISARGSRFHQKSRSEPKNAAECGPLLSSPVIRGSYVQAMLRWGGKDPRIVSAMSGAELPAQLTRMVGRRRELGQIGELLDRDSVRLLTLVGPGGGGKTRLAIAVAEAWRARHGSRLF